MSQRRAIPVNAVLISLAVAILLSPINIGSTVALSALFTLGVGSSLTSYTISIGCLIRKRLCNEPLPSRAWSLGRYGLGINLASICFLAVLLVWSFFPPVTPVKPTTMNWGCLIFGVVVIFATVYYILIGKKVYTPPVGRVCRDLNFHD